MATIEATDGEAQDSGSAEATPTLRPVSESTPTISPESLSRKPEPTKVLKAKVISPSGRIQQATVISRTSPQPKSSPPPMNETTSAPNSGKSEDLGFGTWYKKTWIGKSSPSVQVLVWFFYGFMWIPFWYFFVLTLGSVIKQGNKHNANSQQAILLIFPQCPLCKSTNNLSVTIGRTEPLFLLVRRLFIVTCSTCNAVWEVSAKPNATEVERITIVTSGTTDLGIQFLNKPFSLFDWHSKFNPELAKIPADVLIILKQVPREEIIEWLEGEDKAVAYSKDTIWVASQKAISTGALVKGPKVKSFLFEHVRSIDVQVGLQVILEIGSGNENNQPVAGLMGMINAWKTENMVSFKPNQADEVMRFAARVRETMKVYRNRSNVSSAALPTSAVINPLEQIRVLAKLRDDGIISTDEFESKKSDLMKRI